MVSLKLQYLNLAQAQPMMITFGPTIATPRLACYKAYKHTIEEAILLFACYALGCNHMNHYNCWRAAV
jgi:hypothetical protein